MKNWSRQLAAGRSKAMLVLCILACSIIYAQQGNSKADERKIMEENLKQMAAMIPQKPEDISPLLYGEKIPVVSLLDTSGKDFDLNKAIAKKPTILIFYRGGWCPFCSKQLSGLEKIAPDLEKEGYQLIAVSTDEPEGLRQTTTKEKLNYTLLSDADLNVSKQFGIAFKAPESYWEMLPKTTGGKNVDLLLPVPSVFILDRKGVIHFEYINPDFKMRLSPELLSAVAKHIKKDL
ncbi:MAG: peroxiredoxin-like family protein [Flavobacterium sp.]